MTASTKALVEAYGPTDSKTLIYVDTDDTHLKPLGATLFAQLVVGEMIGKGILAAYLNPAVDLVVSPSTMDFGNRYVSTTLDKAFSVTGLAIAPDAGNVTITAPEGFLVGAAAAGPFAASIDIPYTGGKLPPTSFYVRFAPAAVQRYAGDLTVRPESGSTKTVALAGNGLAAPAGVEESLVYGLTADTTCTSATGFASCTAETFTGLYVKNYAAVGTFAVSQRVSILDATPPDTWPAEIDINPLRYVEFTVTPVAGKTFTIDSISLYAGAAGGSGMAFRISYSTQSDFSTATDLGNFPTNVSNAMNLLSFSPIVSLADGETLRLRVYPWYKSVAATKYLCLQTLTIHGRAE